METEIARFSHESLAIIFSKRWAITRSSIAQLVHHATGVEYSPNVFCMEQISNHRLEYLSSMLRSDRRYSLMENQFMSHMAICTRKECAFIWESSDLGDLPPFFCPLCRSQTLNECKACGYPILLVCSSCQCSHCYAPLRQRELGPKRQNINPTIHKTA